MAPERVAQQLSRKALEEEWRLAFSDAFFMQFRHFVSHNIEVAQDVDQLSGAMSINEFESRVGEAWSANRVLCVNDPKNELEWRDSIADTIPSVFQDCYGEVTTVEIEPHNPEIEEEDIGIERIVVEVFGPARYCGRGTAPPKRHGDIHLLSSLHGCPADRNIHPRSYPKGQRIASIFRGRE